MANASDLSLRGGQRPTWRPEREARGSALGVQSREGTHADRTRHCRGADSRARRRTYSPYKPPSKWQTLPTCHCEAPKGPWQSWEGSHVDRTRYCRGADSRARRRTYSPYKPPSKWQTLPICHCEEAFRILPYSFFSLQDSFISVPRPYSELPGKAQKSSDLSIGAYVGVTYLPVQSPAKYCRRK